VKAYLIRLLVSLDQLLNTICLGLPDETISSRVGKAAERGDRLGLILESLINALFLEPRTYTQPGHCRRVIERDEA
jgi:hypothetical protein